MNLRIGGSHHIYIYIHAQVVKRSKAPATVYTLYSMIFMTYMYFLGNTCIAQEVSLKLLVATRKDGFKPIFYFEECGNMLP